MKTNLLEQYIQKIDEAVMAPKAPPAPDESHNLDEKVKKAIANIILQECETLPEFAIKAAEKIAKMFVLRRNN
jgi:hypothetical protein